MVRAEAEVLAGLPAGLLEDPHQVAHGGHWSVSGLSDLCEMFSPSLTTINWIQSLPSGKVSKYLPGPGWEAENVTIKVQNSGYNLHNIGIILSSAEEWDNVFNPHP